MKTNRPNNQPGNSHDVFSGRVNYGNKLDNNIRTRFRSSYKPEIQESRVKYVDGFIKNTTDKNIDNKKPHSSDPDSFTHDNKQNDTIDNYFSNITNNQLDREFKPKKIKKERKKLFGRKKPGKLKLVARSFSFLLIALVVGAGSILGYGYLKSRNIFNGDGTGAVALQKDVDPAKLNGEGDGRVNILLLGKGGPGHEAPDLTDTILLASIDPIANEVALISVPRDMYVKDRNGYSTKINAIYSGAKQTMLAKANKSDSDKDSAENAGLSAIETAVTDVLGVPVHYNVMVDFTAFKDAINTVGGITVDVQEPLYDADMAHLLGGSSLVADEGLQTFDGERALLYSRSRNSPRSDFDRTERQREVIVALQQKMMSAGTFSNPFKVVELIGNFGDHVRTDLNGVSEIKRLYEISQNISADKIISLGLADPPNVLVTTDQINSQSVVVPVAGLYQYEDIRSYIRNTIRDPFLKRENARIIIFNGTGTAGLATATSEELKSYGYNVISVDNAPTSDYIESQLIDLSNGVKEYTKSYIQKRLGLTATNTAPVGLPTSAEADFIIILGTDEITENSN